MLVLRIAIMKRKILREDINMTFIQIEGSFDILIRFTDILTLGLL